LILASKPFEIVLRKRHLALMMKYLLFRVIDFRTRKGVLLPLRKRYVEMEAPIEQRYIIYGTAV